MLTLADLGVLRGVEATADAVDRDDHPDLLRLPGDGGDARRPARPRSPTAGYAPGRGAHRALARRGAPTGSPRTGAASWPSAASRRPGRPAPRGAGPGPADADPPRAAVRCPRCGSPATEEISRFGPTACRRCAAARVPGAVRAREGDLMPATATDVADARTHGLPHAAGRRRRAALRRRRGRHLRRARRAARRVRLPARQYLTLRHAPTAARSAAPTRSAPRPARRRGSACGGWTAGCSPSGWWTGCGPGDEVEVGPAGRPFTPDLGRGHAPRAGRGRLRDHPGAVDRRVGAGRAPGHPRHPALRQPAHGHVMFAEELADLKNAYGPRLHLVHVLSREPIEAEIFTGRLDADQLRTLLGALVDVADVDHWWLCGPLGHDRGRGRGARRARRGPQAGAPRAVLRRRAAARAAPPGRPRGVEGATSEVTVVLDGRATTLRCRGTCRCSTPRRRSAATCRSPARAGCAAPAGPG